MLLVACNEEEDPNEFVQEQGNTVQVILDSTADPLIKDKADKMSNGTIDYRLKPGSPIPEPGVTKNTTAPTLEGYLFVGYYEGAVGDNGVLYYGNKWDFSTKVSSDMTLYGKWVIQYKIRINYVLDGTLSEEYEDVGVLNNAASVSTVKTPSWAGNTFVQMYRDAACTDELVVSSTQQFEHGCDQDNPICNVYAKFISGVWTLVRTANDLKSVSAGARLYLLDDIDMSSLNDADGYTQWSLPNDFIGTIDGDGHTISNINYRRVGTNIATGPATNNHFGLFGRINNATIKNITFDNCTVEGVVNRQSAEYFYGFIAGREMGECTLDNISFVNCTLKQLNFAFSGYTDAMFDTEMNKVDFGVGDGVTNFPKIV